MVTLLKRLTLPCSYKSTIYDQILSL